MENLNAEAIKKALECCVTDSCVSCPYDDVGVYSQCVPTLLENALALINLQEQRIKELTEELDDAKRDTIPKLRLSLERANAMGVEADKTIEKLTEENERLRAIPKQMHERLQAYFGTYVLGYKIPLSEAIKTINQIAKEMLEGYNGIQDK